MAGQVQLKFETGGAPPRGSFHSKSGNFQFGTIELWIHENGIFLVTVKYTLVCRVPALAVVGRMTHYCVS